MRSYRGEHPGPTVSGGDIYLSDETAGVAKVTIADVRQSNGVIHVIDKMLQLRS